MWAIETIVVAFSMYSRLPTPRVEWSKQNMRYVYCAFPFVGAIVGLAVWGWLWLATRMHFGEVLRAAGMTLLPLLITGGIHMDGFCDTTDALASHVSRERKLEIMKDPHAGAFAVLGACGYLLAYFALATELLMTPAAIAVLACGFVVSRILGGYAVIALPSARPDGLARTFSDGAAKRATTVFLAVLCLAAALCLALANVVAAMTLVLVYLVFFLLFRRMALREFGGVTGDLAGWLIQMAELLALAAAVMLQTMGVGL